MATAYSVSTYLVGGVNLKVGTATGEPITRLPAFLNADVVVVGRTDPGLFSLTVEVSDSLRGKVRAGELLSTIAKHVGGLGGGRPNRSQCGGSNPSGLQQALDASVGALAAQLGVLPPSEAIGRTEMIDMFGREPAVTFNITFEGGTWASGGPEKAAQEISALLRKQSGKPMSRASEAARNLADAVQAAKDAAARSADALHYAATVTLAKAKAEGEMLTPATKRAAATIAAMAGVAPVSTLAAAVAAAKEAVMQSTAAVKRSKEAQDELIRTIEVFGSPVSDSERHARAALAEAGIANPSTALLRARLTLGHTKEARDLAHGWPGMLGVHGQTDLISALDQAETIARAAYRCLLIKEKLNAC